MMTLHRTTTTALAALLLAGTLGGCADYTTTGVPADETAAAEAVSGEGHSQTGEKEGAMNADEEISALAGTLVGMPADEAEQVVTEAGYTWRIASVDGEPRALTMDFRTDRINAEIEQDTVTRVTVG
ncbi:MAG: hypothetical protein WCF36_05345 [Candidatus Nanopelagicales bacterium]